ncbi:response regulator [Desulfobulbus rhabdoformis]|uniref:ATP-binding protein n=1 Tax=Desulfobulbus rhabdoformis TaxID=34032 RepID=UPI001965ECC3|nr:ATP-binding protein [Desulfobulbus rhabdoformis]MBM9613361.1 response regulator [Desulfobulbus rhabdoformis]
MQWFFMAMVAAGTLILSVSVHNSRRLSQLVPETFKPKWRILTLLIACFIVGYCGYLVIQFTHVQFPLPLLISTIFFGGSLFVYGIISLIGHTLHTLKKLNDNLESEIKRQTHELHESNQQLSQSQQELTQQNIFLHSVINALPHPFLVLDPETHTILLANTAAGLSPQAAPTTCHMLSHGSPCPCTGNDHPCPVQEIKKSGAPIVVEHLHHTSEGEKRIVEVHGYPVFNVQGELTQIIEYSIDITEKKETEDELIQAKLNAEEASAAKGTFLANMSHEIRTPMNAIMGISYLALQTELTPEQRNCITKVHHSATHLLRILNDILDISKLEAGRMLIVPESFVLADCINQVTETFQVQAQQKGLKLTTSIEQDVPRSFKGDALRLRQVLVNLVGNAIKFTQSGSVDIRVHLANSPPKEAERIQAAPAPYILHFRVCDTGIGIPPDLVERIFTSFEQGDISSTRQFGGTGLGLSICSQIIELMGGEIWAESTLQEGSCFHFTIPLVLGEMDAPPEDAPKVEVLEKQIDEMRILLVDDNEINREVATMMLETHHSVTSASNGLEALRALAKHEFDLILMDVQMPQMDGITATGVIRAIERGKPVEVAIPSDLKQRLAKKIFQQRVPIIAMTAHALEEDKNQCLQAGMDDFISKPFQYEQMLSAFDHICHDRLRFA